MIIPDTVRVFLRRSGGQFKGRTIKGVSTLEETLRQANVAAADCVTATWLRSGAARLLVVHPLDRTVNLEVLGQLLERPFSPVDPVELPLFPGVFAPGVAPPLPGLYGLKGVIDSSLKGRRTLHFSGGQAGLLVQCSGEDFLRLVQGCGWAHVTDGAAAATAPPLPTTREAMKRTVSEVRDLPAMPGMAVELLKLKDNPYAHICELAAIIQQDPSLSAQVIRYASSPYFGCQGKIESTAMAIQLLGFDFVQDLAFGLSLTRPFRNPRLGPLGLNSFWRHATWCAALTQRLCSAIPYPQRPSAGTAYLAGLLHNFGFLLLGHLFPGPFHRLSRALVEQPERPVIEVERELLGLSHTELGLWLMDAWNMPPPLLESVREHHNPDVVGEYAVYPKVVYVANQLLSRHGIGDGAGGTVSAVLLAELGLDSGRVAAALEEVLGNQSRLDEMARKMVA